jgi:hypothetical protein
MPLHTRMDWSTLRMPLALLTQPKGIRLETAHSLAMAWPGYITPACRVGSQE